MIYVSMLLSGGMPIAFVSAAFWFVSAYWCDKYELLSLSRRPVIYGAALSNHVMNLLPYAAVSKRGCDEAFFTPRMRKTGPILRRHSTVAAAMPGPVPNAVCLHGFLQGPLF